MITVTPHNGMLLLHIADKSTSPQGSNAKLPQLAKINSTIFKQETIKSWFSGVGTSVNNEVIQPFQNANSVINKYNLAIQNNSLTQQGWQRLLAQSDDSLKAYLTSIKGSTASMAGYNVSLQGSITGVVHKYQVFGFLCIDYKYRISKREMKILLEYTKAMGDLLYIYFYEVMCGDNILYKQKNNKIN